jgi:hypothetical protein
MVEHGVMLFMLKDKLYIHDTMFNHAKSSSWYNEPELFEWVRKYDENHLVFTDFSLHHVDHFNNPKKYAWLLESPEITPNAYQYIAKNYDKFDMVFTFSKDLLEISDKFVLIPYGGCWIDVEDRIIHEKSKDISIILSAKQTTVGHRFRHTILKTFPALDYFGFNNPIEKKITALKDYRFSIVIENCQKDYYFSEKLIDCFITGTIPIYWGCQSIGKFFDVQGILTFNNLEELELIINSLSDELYVSKLDSIKNNFFEAKKYLVADNLIYDKIIKI